MWCTASLCDCLALCGYPTWPGATGRVLWCYVTVSYCGLITRHVYVLPTSTLWCCAVALLLVAGHSLAAHTVAVCFCVILGPAHHVRCWLMQPATAARHTSSSDVADQDSPAGAHRCIARHARSSFFDAVDAFCSLLLLLLPDARTRMRMSLQCSKEVHRCCVQHRFILMCVWQTFCCMCVMNASKNNRTLHACAAQGGVRQAAGLLCPHVSRCVP